MLTNTISGKKERLLFVVALFVLVCFYPYEFYSVYLTFLPERAYLTAAFFSALLFFICTYRHNKGKAFNLLRDVLLVQTFGFIIVGVAHSNILSAIGSCIYMTLATILVVLINETIGFLEFYRRYNRWIMWMAVFGVITWALVIFTGWMPFSTVIDRADGRVISNYILTFSKTDVYVIMSKIRYAGFFDEPGAMAYWGMFALIINQLYIKDKKLEIVLLICLSFTFSIGYYVQVLLYLVLFHVDFKKAGQNLFVIIAIVALVIGVFMSKGTQYEAIYDMSIGRLTETYDESRRADVVFAVDDRADLTLRTKQEFMRNPLFGTESNKDDLYITDNIYEPLALYGIIGAPLILFPFIYLTVRAIRRKDTLYLKAMAVILLSFTHRPFHAYILYFFVIYSMIVLYRRYGNGQNLPALSRSTR